MVPEKTETVLICLIENYWHTLWQSIAWYAVLTIAMAFAVWIDSIAMQWVMAFMWMLALLSTISETYKKRRFTIADARKKLDELEAQHK